MKSLAIIWLLAALSIIGAILIVNYIIASAIGAH